MKEVLLDTETTGLNFMVDKPFIIGIEFNKNIYTTDNITELMQLIYDLPFKFQENGEYQVTLQQAMRENGKVNGVVNFVLVEVFRCID